MQLDPARTDEVRPVGGTSSSLAQRYRDVRATTMKLTAPLATEDFVVQSMPDVSPTKWHLAHTTWFFETFILRERPGFRPFDPAFEQLFNSYYNTVGSPFPRPRRGLLSRPTVDEVRRYRAAIDEAMGELLAGDVDARTAEIVELGLHHEQQHQELIVTDIKHVLGQNPLEPDYGAPRREPGGEAPALAFTHVEPGMVEIGHDGVGFCFDNERPRHRLFAPAFALANRLVTCGDYAAFIADGGYRRHELWLSEGWDWVQREGIAAPLYWLPEERVFTLAGGGPRDPAEPVVHVSLYEADAYARWAGARLPREHELELVAAGQPPRGNLLESGRLHPRAAQNGGMTQLFGDVWTWTQSAYLPYPGYAPPDGALGEYNGKFMCNQHVLRGGSCATAQSHIRATYRNFFPAHARWQFSGIRLCKDVPS